jgi:o-succinylbenzoate synthase
VDDPGSRIASVRWRPWRIPFRDEFRTSDGAFRVREGVVIKIRDENGLAGIGEASPLPEYAGGSVESLTSALSESAATLVGQSPSSAVANPFPKCGDDASRAALRCGLETACMDIGSRQTSIPAGQWLANVAGLPSPNPATGLPVNGTVDAATAKQAAARARVLVDAGFATLKLKVGGAVSDDLERIEAVRAAVGDAIELRIDANGGWDVESARRALQGAAKLGVSMCEQPLSPSDAGVLAHTAALREETAISIALDESCRSVRDVEAVITADAADAIVAKPMLTGLIEGARMLRVAVKVGLVAIVTTAFDTSIGTAAAAHLATLLPPPRRACGLGTASLLAGDLVKHPMPIERGVMHLGGEPGLGVTLDEGALESFATGPWSSA